MNPYVIPMVMQLNDIKKPETFFSNHFKCYVEVNSQKYYKDPYSNIINVYWNLYLDIPSGYVIKTNDIKQLIFEKIVNTHFNGNYNMALCSMQMDDHTYREEIVVNM